MENIKGKVTMSLDEYNKLVNSKSDNSELTSRLIELENMIREVGRKNDEDQRILREDVGTANRALIKDFQESTNAIHKEVQDYTVRLRYVGGNSPNDLHKVDKEE